MTGEVAHAEPAEGGGSGSQVHVHDPIVDYRHQRRRGGRRVQVREYSGNFLGIFCCYGGEHRCYCGQILLFYMTRKRRKNKRRKKNTSTYNRELCPNAKKKREKKTLGVRYDYFFVLYCSVFSGCSFFLSVFSSQSTDVLLFTKNSLLFNTIRRIGLYWLLKTKPYGMDT